MAQSLALVLAAAVGTALASTGSQAGPAERAGRIDKRLTAAERRGVWAQGSRADRREDRFDRREDRADWREDRRDARVHHGPRDRVEDVLDRRENRRDRAENRIDRAGG